MDKTSQNQIRRGNCAETHSTRACTVASSSRHRKCAVCKKDGHEAWSAACEVRGLQRRRAQMAYKSRPTSYTMISRQGTPDSRARATNANTGLTDTPMEDSKGGITTNISTLPKGMATAGSAENALSLEKFACRILWYYTTALRNHRALGIVTAPKRPTRRSRSASPRARDLSTFPDRQGSATSRP